jgi:hypothetical protein
LGEQNGAVAIYDAMDGPTYASLRPAVRDRRIAGWGFLTVGVLGVIVLLAIDEAANATEAVFVGVLFAIAIWLIDYRGRLRTGLAAPAPATDRATYKFSSRRRLLAGPAAVMPFIAVCFVFGVPSPVGIALGLGFVELAAGAKLRDWERKDGRTLFTTGMRLGDLFAR